MIDVSDVTRFAARLVTSDAFQGEWKSEWVPKVANEIRHRAPVLTGELRNSIAEVEDGVDVGARYAVYVERGTSDTPPQPFVAPSLDRLVRPAAKDAARQVIRRLT